VTSIGTYLQKHPEREILKATMQGGFLPYSIYRPKQTSEKFNGKETMPTFNLNGDRINGVNFLNGNVKKRRMVGKNVCHNVIFTKELAQRSSGLFLEAANLYFSFDRDKKFHDPTAAICHLHPEIGCWIKGKTIKMNDGWTTIEHGEDEILADLDHELFWEILLN
jgi:pyrimidine-specific ribonucleoside hydrolase